jgi:fructokinase
VAHLAGRASIVVDPNVRAAAIDDERGFRERLDRILRVAQVVKVSDDDAAWLRPGQPVEETARALLAAGPAVVLLTRGAAGALVVTAAGERDVPAVPVEVVDTIGAGDAFCGGFLSGWCAALRARRSTDDLGAVADAAGLGVLVASMTCERAGASPPTLDEVRAAQRLGGAGVSGGGR